MLATTIVCPHCSKALKATKPLATGKKVLCKQCGTTFRVPPPDVSAHTSLPTRTIAALPTAVVAPVAAFAGAGSGVEEEPIATELDGGRVVTIALVALVLAGGFLLIGGGSALALVYAARKERTAGANANNEQTTPDRPKSPGDQEPPLTPPPDSRPLRPGLNDPEDNEKKPHEVEPVSVPRLPPEEQEKVNRAIEKGLAHVKKLPTKWGNGAHVVGLAALQSLTLLECGVPPDDATVQAVAQHLRDRLPQTYTTYDVSLALLFLDRLGDAADRGLIQTLALRLVAGQQADGGWNYDCKKLNSNEQQELLTILEQTRPRNPLELFVDDKGKVSPEFVVPRPGEKLPEFVVPGKGETTDGGNGSRRDKPADIAKALAKASPNIRNLPGLQPPGKTQMNNVGSDNSNTQFAILAVWVASRYDIPVERTLALIVKRFRTSQDKQGRWGYHYQKSPPIAQGELAMTCAGLLGLGAGYGMSAAPGDKAARQPAIQDKAVLAGFKALEKAFDHTLGDGPRKRIRQPMNLYLLWSIERVGVMYNVTNLGDKDWYRLGAEQLVEHQQANGSWTNGGYFGANPTVDTCFALLFLKRANLAKDLSKKLEYIIDVKDVGNK